MVTPFGLIAVMLLVMQGELQHRRRLLTDLKALREPTERSNASGSMDEYRGQAWDLSLGNAMSDVFDLSREPQALRERYGRHLWGRGTRVARRLVEA